MKPYGAMPLRKLCSRTGVCFSISTLLQMTSQLLFLILCSLTVSSQLGLEDVFFSPQNQTVMEGEGVFLQCVSGESSPPATITWLKDGNLVTRGRQIHGEYGGGHQKKTSGTLHLFNVTLEDDGIYVCVTYNPLMDIKKESRPAKITVQEVPKRLHIIQGPKNITVAMGTEASVHCVVRGFPVPMVHWFKDGYLLTNGSASFILQNNGQLLIFRNVTKDDEGSYHCEASNQKEGVRSQTAFLIPAEMEWSFVQQPTDLIVRRGENVTVTCRPPYSRPTAQVSWFKNNQLFTPTAHVTVLQSGDLFFNSIQENDSGNYFCRASNSHLQRHLSSRRATLTVLAPPSVKVWPQVLTVPVGAQVALECQVSGRPLPSITWVKRGHSKQTGGRIAVGFQNASLHIQSARSYDEGEYVCEASNTLGQDRSTAMLKVAVSPVIVTFAGHLSSRIAASVVMLCKAVGVHPITYTWSRDRAETRSPITPTEDRHVDEDGALHISSVQWSDAGEYYCTAENRAGRHQRRTVLTVTAEDGPADSDKQARLNLSANNIMSKARSNSHSRDPVTEQNPKTTHHPLVQTQQMEVICSTLHCNASPKREATSSRPVPVELKMPPLSLEPQTHHLLNRPNNNPPQPLITQITPPMLPPPPHPNFQSVDLHTRLSATSAPLFILNSEPSVTHGQASVITRHILGSSTPYALVHSQSYLTAKAPRSQLQHHVIEDSTPHSKQSNMFAASQLSHNSEPITDTASSLSPVPLSDSRPSRFPPLSQTQNPITKNEANSSGSVAVSSTTELHLNRQQHAVTKSHFSKFHIGQSSTQTSQAKLENSNQHMDKEAYSQLSPTLSKVSKSHPQEAFTQTPFAKVSFQPSTILLHLPSSQPMLSSSAESQQPTHGQLSSTQTEPTVISATLAQNQPRSPPTQHPQFHLQSPQQEPPPHRQRKPLPDQTSELSTFDSKVHVDHRVTVSNQVHLNDSQQGQPVQPVKSANDTELNDGLKRNTSQSPMISNDPRDMKQSPSWLPVLEKHDIPIVVGVGVSLAFIFITVTFYSVVQKNDPAPTSRTAQRNFSVPGRHAERRAAGRTYENRAFEDDDCVAVIEQSPNTSDTRARPPGPSLVKVHMEPTSDDLQEDIQPSPDNCSVSVEPYPEPILDAKVDSSVDEKGCSLSQPSIQLHAAEDWAASIGDNHSSCHDTLPPPSSLPSRSPSPSPPSTREEGVHSSLTLQVDEPCGAPLHHNLSISHGNPPLLLSHHVTLGLTTVAVDIHFYPAATVSMALSTSTHITSVSSSTSVAAPLFSPPLSNSQETNQSAGTLHHPK